MKNYSGIIFLTLRKTYVLLLLSYCFLYKGKTIKNFDVYFDNITSSQKKIVDISTLGAKALPNFDNTQIFQYALDHYNIVYIPKGVYEYDKIEIRNKDTHVYGDGMGKTILKSTTKIKDFLHLKPNIRILNSNCLLEGITSTYKNMPDYQMNANGRNAINEDANIAIGWSEAHPQFNSFIVENVVVRNCEVIGAIVQGIAIGVSSNVKIIDNKITQTRGTGIFGYYSDKILVMGNDVSKTGDDGIYIGANGSLKYSPHSRNRDVVITKNKVYNTSAKGIGLSGCENGEISNNEINSTFADGILISKDKSGGHVSPRKVKIFRNILSNIFGEYGAGFKHKFSAQEVTGGFYAMIGVITEENLIDGNYYEIFDNISSADNRMFKKYGFYGSYIFGKNVSMYNNKFSKANYGIMIGNPSSIENFESRYITLKDNSFDFFKRNVLLIKSKDILIEENYFGDAEYCITEERVQNVDIINNKFNDQNKFILIQTGSKVNISRNVFKK